MSVDISVVIPTFRRMAELNAALSSVLSQQDVTLEVFVVDDCPDGSAAAAFDWRADRRVTYIRNPRPTGGVPSVVRNLAWPSARGKLVHFLDDDDLVPEGHYAAVKAEFEENPNVGLIFGRVEPFGSCSSAQLAHEREYFARAARNARRCGRFGSKAGFVGRTLFGPAMLVCSAGIVQRRCVVEVDGFDPNIALYEDTDFFLRVMRACGAKFTDRVTLHYRIGNPSLLHSPDPRPGQKAQELAGRQRIWQNYRQNHGPMEFFALAGFARTMLRYV